MLTNRRIVSVAVMLGTFLAALDTSIIGTSMPTIIGNLGGMSLFPWVFSIYLLTGAVTTPIYGKLADLFGRRKVYAYGAGLFLLGSILCGFSQNIVQLIIFRGLQGIGSGAILPITITIIGDIYSAEERARMQGIFGSVWGISAIIGPAVGGIIVSLLDWRWIFYINLPIGLISIILILIYLQEIRPEGQPKIDYWGAFSLTTGMTLLLLALLEGGTAYPWNSPFIISLFASAGIILMAFYCIESRVMEPMMSLELFSDRLIGLALLANFFSGAVMMGASAYIPLFVQGVTGGTAIMAGAAIAPMSIGWPLGSTICGRILFKVGYKRMALLGAGIQVLSAVMLLYLYPDVHRFYIPATSFVMGLGMGFSSTALIVIVQAAVEWSRRGIATAGFQFMRTLGAAFGVAILGAVSNNLLLKYSAAGPNMVDLNMVNSLLDPVQRSLAPPENLASLASILSRSIHGTFWLILVFALAGIIISLGLPQGGYEKSSEKSII